MFGEKILDYWDDIMKDLGDIIAIPSVAQPQDGPYPFGKDAATAVDKAIEIAERYGIKTKNSDYYAMHAELGEGEENAVVMAHLDVVPAGEGWDSHLIRDGKAFGRGVSDNKGPAIVALHCLRALKEAGVVGKRKLRVVLGSAEEIGMQDMGHYFSKEQMPTMGFTPDACYGVCHCEKGLFRFAVTGKVGKKIVSFKAGTVVNAVPYKAEADVLCDDDEFAKLVEAANAAEVKFDIARTESGAHIVATGKAAHASTPEIGINAAAHLAHLLVNVFGADCGEFLMFMDEKVGFAYDGSNIGVKMSDEPSGALTFNLGLVNIENGEGRFDIDIRYPATKSGAEIDKILAKSVEGTGPPPRSFPMSRRCTCRRTARSSACFPALMRMSPAKSATSSPWAAARMPARWAAQALRSAHRSTKRNRTRTRQTSASIWSSSSCTHKSALRPCTACLQRTDFEFRSAPLWNMHILCRRTFLKIPK